VEGSGTFLHHKRREKEQKHYVTIKKKKRMQGFEGGASLLALYHLKGKKGADLSQTYVAYRCKEGGGGRNKT